MPERQLYWEVTTNWGRIFTKATRKRMEEEASLYYQDRLKAGASPSTIVFSYVPIAVRPMPVKPPMSWRTP
jgi:hypothetical protein